MNYKILFLLLLIILFLVYNFVLRTKENFNQDNYPELSFTIENSFFSPIKESLHKYLVKILAIDNSNIVSESNDEFEVQTFTSSNPGEAKNTINNKNFRKYESEFRVKNNFYKKLINLGNQNSPSPSPSGSDNITIKTMTNINYTDEEKEKIKNSYLNYISNSHLEVFKNLGSNKEKNHIFLKNKNLVDLSQESTGIFCLDSNCEINFNLENYSLNHNFDADYNNSVINPIRTYLENFIPFFEYIKQKENKDKIMGIVLDNHLLNFGIIIREVEITENNDSFTFDIIYKTEVFNSILPITQGNSINYYFNNKNLKRQNELNINKNILNQKEEIINHFVETAVSRDICTTFNKESIDKNCPYQHRNVDSHILYGMEDYVKNFNKELLKKTADELNIGKKYFFEILKYFFINDKNLFDFIEFKYYSNDDSKHWTDKKINPSDLTSMEEVIIANNNFNIINDTFLNENNLDDEEYILKLYFYYDKWKFNYLITQEICDQYLLLDSVNTKDYIKEVSENNMGLKKKNIKIDDKEYQKYTIISKKEMKLEKDNLEDIDLEKEPTDDTKEIFKQIFSSIMFGSETILGNMFSNSFDIPPVIILGSNPILGYKGYSIRNMGISFELGKNFKEFNDSIFSQKIEKEEAHEATKKFLNKFKNKTKYIVNNYDTNVINYLIFDSLELNFAVIKTVNYEYTINKDKQTVNFIYEYQIDIYNHETEYSGKTYKLDFDYIKYQIMEDANFFTQLEYKLNLITWPKIRDYEETLTEQEKKNFQDFLQRVFRYYDSEVNEKITIWEQYPPSNKFIRNIIVLSFIFKADKNVESSIKQFKNYIDELKSKNFFDNYLPHSYVESTNKASRMMLTFYIDEIIKRYEIYLKKMSKNGKTDYSIYSEENSKNEKSSSETFVSNYIVETFESKCNDLKLADGSPFRDNELINPLTCKDFYTREYCVDGSATPSYIEDTTNLGDISAEEACCICGGGDGGTLNLKHLGYEVEEKDVLPLEMKIDVDYNLVTPQGRKTIKDNIARELDINPDYIIIKPGSIIIIINIPDITKEEKIKEIVTKTENIKIDIPLKDGTKKVKTPEVKLNSKLEEIYKKAKEEGEAEAQSQTEEKNNNNESNNSNNQSNNLNNQSNNSNNQSNNSNNQSNNSNGIFRNGKSVIQYRPKGPANIFLPELKIS